MMLNVRYPDPEFNLFRGWATPILSCVNVSIVKLDTLNNWMDLYMLMNVQTLISSGCFSF